MDVFQADPFLRPYWRHERVLELRQSIPPRRCSRRDDIWIQGYREFLLHYDRGMTSRERLLAANPGLFYAHKIQHLRESEPETALMIEARLLAGMSYQEIAANVKTYPKTIEWFEKLYFNVIDRLSYHDWIIKSILLPAYEQYSDMLAANPVRRKDTRRNKPLRVIREISKPHLDMSLKFFAYFGGPLVCDIMISGFQRHQHVRNADDLSDYFNRQFELQIQRRSVQAAMTFNVNSFNVMELFAVHSRLLEIQRSGRGAEDKRSEFEKNVGALMKELPWGTGRAGAALHADQPIAKYDEGAAELDADEVIQVGLGNAVPDVLELNTVDVFRPRPRSSKHASVK